MEGIDYGKSVEIMTQFDVVHGPYRVDALNVSPEDEAASKLEIVGRWVSALTRCSRWKRRCREHESCIPHAILALLIM